MRNLRNVTEKRWNLFYQAMLSAPHEYCLSIEPFEVRRNFIKEKNNMKYEIKIKTLSQYE